EKRASPMPDDTPSEPRRIIADLRRELAQAKAERDEALAQQQAIADVLALISASPGDLAPVFDAMLEKAMRLCEATFGNLMTYDGEFFHFVADRGHPRFAEWIRQLGPVPATPGTTNEGIVQGAEFAQIVDIADDEGYRRGDP